MTKHKSGFVWEEQNVRADWPRATENHNEAFELAALLARRKLGLPPYTWWQWMHDVW